MFSEQNGVMVTMMTITTTKMVAIFTNDDDNDNHGDDDVAGYIMGSCLVSIGHSLMPSSHAIHDDRFR